MRDGSLEMPQVHAQAEGWVDEKEGRGVSEKGGTEVAELEIVLPLRIPFQVSLKNY